MKFSSNLLSLVALVLASNPSTVHAAPAETCADQAPCIEFTMTKLDTDACDLRGECTIEVCFELDGSKCTKGGTESFSHMCSQSDSNGCPVWKNNDGITPLLGAGSGTSCSDSGKGSGVAAFGGKCSGNKVSMCQEGKPGDTLYWILKDGSDKNEEVADLTFRKAVNGCAVEVACGNFEHNCGSKANDAQRKVERTWAFTIPNGTGSCPSACEPVIPPTWTTFAERKNNVFSSDISPARLTAHMNANPDAIIHRHCADCSRLSHRDIYYKRVTPVPDQAAFDADSGYAVDFVDLFVKNWASTPSNALNNDFKLYSSYEDAIADVDAWTYCNYDDDWVGFPRDCGPTGFVPGQWVSIHSKTFTFEVTGEVAVLVEEPDVWTTFASKGGGVYSAEISGAALTAHMNANPDAIIHRSCPDCWHSAYKNIYYRRLTPVPDQATFDADSGKASDFVSLFTANWYNTPSNELNVDFKLYSTYEDAVLDNKGWSFCNYNSPGVGFPRDCGPHGYNGHQWINDNSWGRGFTFKVTGEVAKLVDDPEEWTTFASKAGSTISNPLSAARLAAHVNANGSIIRRLCPSCSSRDHKEIYYKRITPVPEQDAFTNARAVLDFVDLFTSNWMSSPNNKINEDFKLYSSYEDAVLDHGAWDFCNYDDARVGFPRDCGRNKLVWHQWTSAAQKWSKDFIFEVEGKVLFNELDAVWTEVASSTGGTFAENEDVTAESFAAHVEQEGAIVHRSCPSCVDSHKDIYYKRITPVPSQSDFDGETADSFLDLFIENWFSTPSNLLNVDFKLYSSYDDAVEDVNAWTFCNYDDEHVGFPRDCGPTASTAGQWNSKSRTDGKDYTLYVSGVVPLPAYNQWDVIASLANNAKKVELNDSILRQHLATTNGIIRRFCPGCHNPLHKEIYYKRISPLPEPSEFDGKTPEDFLDLLLNNWFDEPKNKLNVDFELYSDYLDARTGQNKWKFCNYNDANVGFPRDCGPQQFLPNGWTSMSRWSRDFSFEVEGSFEPIIQASSLPAATEWTTVVEATHTTKIKDYASEAHVMKHVVDSTNGIIRRLCPSCSDSHKEVYYRRLTSFPTPDEYKTSGSAATSFMDMMIDNWYSYPRNVLDTDFALFSTYQDALAGINAWNFCNYDHAGVGFPRDCGPNGHVGWQWTSFERNTGKLFSFAVEGTVPPEPELAALAEMDGWTGVARKSAGIPYQCLTDSEFRTQMEATNGIVRRLCPQCTNPTHREIYYERITTIPDQSEFETSDAKNFLDLFLDNWMKEPSNELNVDFELYSTYEDALKGRNKWTYCNYDDGGVGFPRDCGPNSFTPHQWTSTSRRSADFVFEVEGKFGTEEEECKPPPKACVATGWGDPHLITFDGLKYDAHAIGEVIMMMSQDSDLMVQARLEKVAGHSADPAATTGVAIRENPMADGTEFPLVQVSMASGENAPLTLFSCPVELYVDQVKQDDLAAGYHANDVKVEVHMNTGRIHIEYPDLQLNLKVLKFMGMCHFTVTYALLNDCRPEERIIGLLGSPDDDATNDWMKRDGSVVDLPSGGLSSFFFGPAYEYVTQNWCIYIENESLFTYEPGYNFSSYEHCGVEYNPELERSLEEATPEQIEKCGEGNKACLLEAVNLGEGAADQSLETPGADEEEPPEIRVLKTEASEITTELPDIVLQVPETPPPDGNCPVCRAVGWGDPHIITFDGVSYDVHVKGELTFLKSTDPENDFTIQARTVAVKNHPRGPAVTSGVVVHKTGAPTIQVSLGQDGSSDLATSFDVNDNACPVQLFVNGQVRDITTGTGLTDATVQVKGNRIVVEYLELQMRMDMQVRSWRDECHFSVTYFLADCPCDGSLVGILGQPDGEWSNDWHNHDGTPVDIPRSPHERRGRDAYDYSLTWCLAAEDSHFEYEPEMSHEDFDKCSGTKGDENYDLDLDAIIENAVQETPEVIETCTTDGVLDEGCVIECVYLGEGACDEYVEIVQNAQVADIPETPDETPDDTPDETPDDTPDTPDSPPNNILDTIPDIPDIEDVVLGNDHDEGSDPDTSDNQNTSPTESIEVPTAETATTDGTNAGSLGDPHFRTWNNEHFEYHGQCDLMLAKDPDFADGLGIQVEIRTKLVRFWSYIKSAAIRIGDDILEVQGSADPEDGIAEYWMNLEYQGPIATLGGFPVTLSMRSHKKRSFTIDLSSRFPGEKIEISAYREFVQVDFINASKASFGNVVGMLGDLKTGKLLGRDGTTEVNDFYELGAEWQVRPDEDMLFYRAEDPQFPKACVIPEDPQGERRRRLEEESVTVDQAEAACAGLKNPLDRKDCVYDIMATQDLDMAGAF